MADAVTYLIIDGENIDSTLGQQILEHRPTPEERPRWERLRQFAEDQWGQPVTALFFLNASSGMLPTAFCGGPEPTSFSTSMRSVSWVGRRRRSPG